MRVAHRNDGKERYGRRHSQDNHICNPTPHARQLTIHAGEPVLRLHNFRGTQDLHAHGLCSACCQRVGAHSVTMRSHGWHPNVCLLYPGYSSSTSKSRIGCPHFRHAGCPTDSYKYETC
jgi:hypothetical protein